MTFFAKKTYYFFFKKSYRFWWVGSVKLLSCVTIIIDQNIQ